MDLSSENSQAIQNIDLMHISYGDWICKHKSYPSQSSAHILKELNMQAWNPTQVKKEEREIRAHILWELNMQAQNPTQVKKEEHRIYAHILRELNIQAHHTEFVHIPFENWTCKHIMQISCTYPMRIDHAGVVEDVEIEIETKVNPRQKPH